MSVRISVQHCTADFLCSWWWCAIFFAVAFVVYVFLYEETKYTHTIAGVPQESSQDPLGDIATNHGVPAEIIMEKSDSGSGDKSTPEGTISPDSEKALEETTRKLSVISINQGIPRKTYWQRLAITTPSEGSFSTFARHSYQPLFILFTIPAVGYMSLVYGVMLAWSTVMTTTLSQYLFLPPYNFTAAQVGLMSLPPFIGTTIGSIIAGPLSDWHILYLARRNKGVYEPEMRLWMFIPFIVFVSFNCPP